MPTATRISQYRLSNWGPLTTTFTADAACATAGNTVVTFRNTAGVGLNPECAVHTVGPCYPSGPELDAYASSVYNDVDQFIIGYFSPGFVCPSGWKTVGVAAKASDGSVSTSGIFEATTPLASTTSRIRPLFNPPINAFTAGIDPGETGVVCCPRLVPHPDPSCYSSARLSCFSQTEKKDRCQVCGLRGVSLI